MNFQQLQDRIVAKMAARRRIGWIDYCSDSYDMRVAGARAVRVMARARGERMSMREAMWG